MIRVRHYTRVSAMRRIMAAQMIVARDQNKVFVERADAKPMSPRQVELYFDLLRGKGNAYIEFDAEPSEINQQYNQRMQIAEHYFVGDVDLTSRGAVAKLNY